MALRIGDAIPTKHYFADYPVTRIFHGDEYVWPPMSAVITPYSAPGTHTFNIPDTAHVIDVVLLGGGGGGAGGANVGNGDGQGGNAGTWQTVTLVRGVNIPWATTSITVTVGAGGAGGVTTLTNGNAPGSAGGATTVVIPGYGTITANGGAGGSGTNPPGGSTTYGKSPGNVNWNNVPYVGGAVAGTTDNPSGTGTPGNTPGGGGEGGGGVVFGVASSGGPGGSGQAWIRAYT